MNIIDDNFIELFNMLKIEKKQMNFFDIISPREVTVSEWLSFILNPSINGVGNKPVEKLLESLGISRDLDEYEFDSTNTEVTTDNNQRMDIVIKYKGLWIIIENKVDSLENGYQTEAYYKYIESIKEDNEVFYIYLKPNYNISIPKEKNFIVLTYNKLINKLKEISEFDYYEKEKYKYKYLKEFLVSGDRFMSNEEVDFNNAVLFYMNNKDKMNQIELEYKKQNKRLFDKVKYDVLNHINEKEDKYFTIEDKGTNLPTYIQYFKRNWKNEDHKGAHFELVFNTNQLLASKINCDVSLHLEGGLLEEDIEKFSKVGITRKSFNYYKLAFMNEEPIKSSVELSFTSNEKYKESLNIIFVELDKLIDTYEKVIDDVLK